jgi:hypothetical protein
MLGIRNRIDDALFLWKNGREEGAFIPRSQAGLGNVLTAKPSLASIVVPKCNLGTS